MKGNIYLIPCPLGETPVTRDIPDVVFEAVKNIRHFIVERERSARRFLKHMQLPYPISEAVLYELDKHNPGQHLKNFIAPALEGEHIGVISEAGCPAVADPGALVIRLAHQLGLKVIPLTGPSSILLALMGSGLNGQNFSFNGYLPIEKAQRSKKLRELENRIVREDQTQLFMDTPFRNNQLLQELILNCSPALHLCIATELTLPGEVITTKTLAEWKKHPPELHKKLVMFVMGKG